MNWTQDQVRAAEARIRAGNAVDTTPLAQKRAPLHRNPGRGMNRWETEFAADLELKRHARVIEWWGYEEIKLRLADGTFYTPDFAILNCAGQLSFAEVKGFLRDDANVKFKVAADKFPFLMEMWRKVKGGGFELIKRVEGWGDPPPV